MDLQLDIGAETSSINVPKLSRPTLEIKNNYFIVTDGESFNYYTIKVHPSEDSDLLIRFDKSPPVLLEGMAVVNKKIYKVTLQDLLRRIIRKSREIIQEDENAVGNTNTPSKTKRASTGIDSIGGSTFQGSNESGSSPETELENDKAADLAWNDQIGTLLSIIHSKEVGEWEVTEAP